MLPFTSYSSIFGITSISILLHFLCPPLVFHLCHPPPLILRSRVMLNLWDAAAPGRLWFRIPFIGLSPSHLALLFSSSLTPSLCVSSSVPALGHQLLHGGLSLIPPIINPDVCDNTHLREIWSKQRAKLNGTVWLGTFWRLLVFLPCVSLQTTWLVLESTFIQPQSKQYRHRKSAGCNNIISLLECRQQKW